MAQATTANDTRAAGAAETRGRVRVRVQEILLAAAATAVLASILAFWAWLALSVVQVGKDIVQLRSAVERNTEGIARNAETLQRIEALLLAERSGGATAPPDSTAQSR